MKNFNEKWINLLTDGRVDKQREFEEILANSKCETLAIMKMRRLQMQEGRGQDITVTELLDGNIREVEYLQEVLQELFLEPISLSHIEYFYKTASKKYDNIIDALEELYLRHRKDTRTRFLSIALTI
ncbi:hypothetical protein [Tissierella sp.]|uniref:hypothetical protein n=1 Tax=Tissierella sp. TaxID=41274 RepID=UPI0028A5FAA7|nr:hypothetical protein [Tissierella sp.]